MNSIRWLIDLIRTNKFGRAGSFFLMGLGMVLFLTYGILTTPDHVITQPEPQGVPLTGPNMRLLKLCEKVVALDDCDYTYRGRIICREPPNMAYILDDPAKCKVDADLHNRIMQRFRPMARSVDPLDAPRQIPTPGTPSTRGDGG